LAVLALEGAVFAGEWAEGAGFGWSRGWVRPFVVAWLLDTCKTGLNVNGLAMVGWITFAERGGARVSGAAGLSGSIFSLKDEPEAE
jgi:hypothetical protein